MKTYMVVEAQLHICISLSQMESSSHHTHLSRMQDTSRLSTSQASMFSSFEMNGMCILVYGVINLISTWVRILRSRSATTQIIFIQHQDYQHQLHVISGFHHEVDEICALLEYYAVKSGNSLPTFQNLFVPSSTVKNSKKKKSLKMGLIGCHETLVVRNYHNTLHNIPEGHRSQYQLQLLSIRNDTIITNSALLMAMMKFTVTHNSDLGSYTQQQCCQFPTFQKNILPSSSRVEEPVKPLLCHTLRYCYRIWQKGLLKTLTAS
jgi:hypothetical protein